MMGMSSQFAASMQAAIGMQMDVIRESNGKIVEEVGREMRNIVRFFEQASTGKVDRPQQKESVLQETKII